MHDDHSGIPAARSAPEAAEQEADQLRAGRSADAIAGSSVGSRSVGNSTGNTVAGSGVERPPRQPDPTRYGDWEKDGRCIDF